MRKITILFFLFISISTFARTYYVSSSGNDNNNGLTKQTAWKTLSKVQSESSTFVAGDIISFNGGNEFYGTLTLNDLHGRSGNSITFTSYGNGKAIITGGKSITGWTNHSGNIWKSSSSNTINQAFENNTNLVNARLPELGNTYKVTSVQNKKTQFISKNLIGAPNLVGASIHIQVVPWRWAYAVITSFNSSTGQVTMSKGIDGYEIENGKPFFVCNNLNLLSNKGEWYYDKGKLYVYSSSSPTNISGAIESDGITIKNSNYLVFDNLSINKYESKGVDIHTSNNIIIKNSIIEHNIYAGILSRNTSSNTTIENNVVKGSQIYGIENVSLNSIIKENNVSHIGTLDLLNNNLFYNGIGIEGYGHIINNKITDIGYSGMSVYGKATVVEKNYITNFCKNSSDGAGIYTIGNESSGMILRKNTIIGSHSGFPQAEVNGIYTDDKSKGIIVEDNSISKVYYGMFLHNNASCVYRGNKIYDTSSYGIILKEDNLGAGQGSMVNNVINNNEIFLLQENVLPLKVRSVWTHYDFGTYDYNKYYNMYNIGTIELQTSKINEKYHNNSSWKARTGHDANSTETNEQWANFTIDSEGNELMINGDFNSNTSGWSGGGTLTHDGNNLKGVATSYRVLESPNFATKKGKSYAISFDVKVNHIGIEYINIVQPTGKSVTTQTIKAIDENWSTITFIFNSLKTDVNTYINFGNYPELGALYIDNVSVKEVTYSAAPKQSYFAYNETPSVKVSTLPVGTWENLSGKQYSGSISLQPYTSEILILAEKKDVGEIDANAGDDVSICKGNNVTLTANGGSSYVWNTGETTQSISVNPTVQTTYTVTVSNESGNSATDDVVVTVNNILANAGKDVVINKGDSTTLTASGGDSYVWNTGETTTSITVNPSSTTNYTATVTKGLCEEIDVVKVTVNTSTPIVVTANAGDDVSICKGERIILKASGGSAYQWSTGAITQSITVSPSTTKTFTVTVSEGVSSDSDEVEVIVSNVVADAGLDKSIEEGQSVKLTANGGDSYFWSTGSTEKSITVSPGSTTNYTVTAYKNGCEDADEVEVDVKSKISNPSPVDAFAGDDISICLGEKVILSASGGDSYTWSTGSTNNNIEVNPTRTTTYTLSAARGDVTDMDTVTVTVENCKISSLLEDKLNKGFEVYPNPTHGMLNINVANMGNELNLILVDLNGRIIYLDNIIQGQLSKQIDISKFAKGIYFVKLFNKNQNFIQKVLLM